MIILSQTLLAKFQQCLTPEESTLLSKATQSVYSGRITIDESELGQALHDRIKVLIDEEFERKRNE